MNNRSFNKFCIVCMILAAVLSTGCSTTTTPSQTSVKSMVTAAEPTSKPATLASGVFSWNDMAVKSADFGEQRQVFRSRTGTLDEMEIHVTTLKPGQWPHPPHQHAYEEMVVLKEGTLEATLNGRLIPMVAGSVFFIAPNDLHGVHNTGTTNATYYIITWKTPRSVPTK